MANKLIRDLTPDTAPALTAEVPVDLGAGEAVAVSLSTLRRVLVMPLSVDMLPPGTVTAITNMAQAEALRPDSRRKIDLTTYTQARLIIVTNVGSASVNTPKIIAKYATTNTITLGSYSALGTSAIECVIPSTSNQTVDSGWVNLAAGAKAEVWVSITASGGDGAADPSFGSITLMFR